MYELSHLYGSKEEKQQLGTGLYLSIKPEVLYQLNVKRSIQIKWFPSPPLHLHLFNKNF